MSSNKLIPDLRFPEYLNEGEWETKAIGDVFKSFSGGTPNTSEREYYGGKIPFIRSAEINRDKTELFITEEGLKNSSAKIVNKGDLLVALYGANSGDSAICKINGAINQAILCLQSEHSNAFTYNFLTLKKDWIVAKFIQGGQGNLSGDILKSITVPFPKKKEQQKIASCLSSLDDLIAAHSQKLELLKDHKKGLMQNLFPSAGEKVPKYRFKEFEKDGEWVEKKLGEVSNNVMYGMNAAATVFDGKNIYLRITDIDENSRLISSKSLTSPNGILEDKYLLNEGDLVFARTGASVGKSYLHQNNIGKVYFAGFLIRFSIKDNIPYFIYSQTLTEQYQQWVSKTSMRSGQPGINAEEYKLFTFFIPPTIQEQQKIASCLSSLDALIAAKAEKLEQLKLHKKGLIQGLFPKIKE